MSKNIESLLRRIEERLGVNKKPPGRTCVILSFARFEKDKSVTESLGPIEQWESYKQYAELHKKKSLIAFPPDPQLELIARQRPLTPEELAAFDDSKLKPCVA
jgi:hypothetical protein